MSGKRPADWIGQRACRRRAGRARVSGSNSVFAAGTHSRWRKRCSSRATMKARVPPWNLRDPGAGNHPDAPSTYFDVSLSILGDSYLELGDYPKARIYFEELIARLEPRKAENSTTFQMYTIELNNFAWLERAEGHPDAARAWFKKEIQAIEQSGNSNIELEAVAAIGLGDLEVQHGNLEVADEYHRRAAEVATASHNDLCNPWIGLGMANVALARADPAHAQKLLSDAIATLKASLGDQQYGMLTLRCTTSACAGVWVATTKSLLMSCRKREISVSRSCTISRPHSVKTQMLNVKHHMEESGRCTGILLAAAAHMQDPKRSVAVEQIANGRQSVHTAANCSPLQQPAGADARAISGLHGRTPHKLRRQRV